MHWNDIQAVTTSVTRSTVAHPSLKMFDPRQQSVSPFIILSYVWKYGVLTHPSPTFPHEGALYSYSLALFLCSATSLRLTSNSLSVLDRCIWSLSSICRRCAWRKYTFDTKSSSSNGPLRSMALPSMSIAFFASSVDAWNLLESGLFDIVSESLSTVVCSRVAFLVALI